MTLARTSLGEVRTRRRSRRAAGPRPSARRAASSQNTGARAYQRLAPSGATTVTQVTRVGDATGTHMAEGGSTLPEIGDIIMDMAAEIRPTRKARFVIGYAISLVGAVLFVATCFMPYYGFPGESRFRKAT